MQELSVSQLAAGLDKGDFSSVELTQHFVNRMQEHKDLNAFITDLSERALLQAEHADTLIQHVLLAIMRAHLNQ